jgi:hypothetical protein
MADVASVPLESILCTEELDSRLSRPPEFEKESRALVALTQALNDSPETILQTLADTILDILHCGSGTLARRSRLKFWSSAERFSSPTTCEQWNYLYEAFWQSAQYSAVRLGIVELS